MKPRAAGDYRRGAAAIIERFGARHTRRWAARHAAVVRVRDRDCIAAFGVVGRQAWAFSGLSVAALLLGVTFMLGALAWTGAKLNFSNFVALPITFGISADYSINMLRRFQSEGRHRRTAVPHQRRAL